MAPLTIVDIGASGGLHPRWTTVASSRRAVLVEPDPREYVNLQQTSGQVVINSALSERPGEIDFHLCRAQPLSSVYRPNVQLLSRFFSGEYLRGYDVVETRRLRADTLDNALAAQGIRTVDAVKVDAQGHELAILRGGTQALGSAIALEVEVEFIELYSGQPFFWDVNAFAAGQGFTLFDLRRDFFSLPETMQYGWRRGQLVCGDALYFRTPGDFLGMTPVPDEEHVVRAFLVYLAYGYAGTAASLVAEATERSLLSHSRREGLLQMLRSRLSRRVIPEFRGKGTIYRALLSLARAFRPQVYAQGDQQLGNRYNNDEQGDYAAY